MRASDTVTVHDTLLSESRMVLEVKLPRAKQRLVSIMERHEQEVSPDQLSKTVFF